MWEAIKSLDTWALVAVVLLAFVLVEFLVIYRLLTGPRRGTREQAYRRGLEYALTELFLARQKGKAEEMDAADELEWQADAGSQVDPSPFDRAIMDVLRNRRVLEELEHGVLMRVHDRLASAAHLGEASQSEVGLALHIVGEIMGWEGEEPAVFVPAYYRLAGGVVQHVRRPLHEHPSWMASVP